MSKKIGRNEPCPCGSGLKYKKCCIGKDIQDLIYEVDKDETKEMKAFKYIESHESEHILNTIISLQLIPENHGKNLRFERIAKHAVTNLNNNKQGDVSLLKKYLKDDFEYDVMEDLPENLFCENIVFHGGNYPVFSGIYSYAIEIFRKMVASIFLKTNNLPAEFINHSWQGIMLLLNLGQILADKMNLRGNIEGGDAESIFKFSEEDIDFSFTREEIVSIANKFRINADIIYEFIISPDDEKFKHDDDDFDLNPLLYYPIVEHKDKYFFLLISNQANAINEYIIRLSEKYKCNEELLKLYHELAWQEIWEACDKMNWKLTDIEIPENKNSNVFNERIFQFDGNRLAYVSYYHSSRIHEKFHEIESRTKEELDSHAETEKQSLDLNTRLKEVIDNLKSKDEFKDFKFLTLSLFDSLGREIFWLIEKAQEKELRLSFTSHQLIQLANTEEWNELSLWKFAKAYDIFSNYTATPLSDTLDLYSMYKANDNSFYFSDDTRPNFLTVLPGDGSHLIKESKIKQDLHGAIAYVENKLVFIPVVKNDDFATLYDPKHRISYYAKCLEGYNYPIWIVNRQVKKSSMLLHVRNFAEAIGFWLFKLQSRIEIEVNKGLKGPIEIELILEEEIFKNKTIKDLVKPSKEDIYSFKYENNKIEFYIPIEALTTMLGSSNSGERKMMKAVLEALNLIEDITINEEKINESIDYEIPIGNAKMILIADSDNDFLIDNRWLVHPVYISSSEINMLLDRLPLLVETEIKTNIPRELKTSTAKKNFFNNVTSVLLNLLQEEIKVFDFNELLNYLMNLHETLVWKREYNKTIVPAQIICFGNDENRVNEILEKEKNLISTSLSTRCLIEYLAAQPISGSKTASYDDIDRLLTIMHEINNYGFLSDAVHFNIDNPKVGKLKSGRIGISREFFDDKIKPFSLAHTKEEIDNYIENFDNRFTLFDAKSKTKRNSEDTIKEDKIDKAFFNDWGFSFLDIFKFCFSCAVICIENETSVLTMKESELIKKLIDDFKLSEKEVIACINKFSLEERDEYLTAPEGYNNSDVFPWKYNREFSLTRRFIVKHKDEDETILLTWGFRNAISAEKQLNYLLQEGKLNYGGKEIEKLLGFFRERKGKRYRNEVKDWLKNTDGLIVCDYEVEISTNGHLKAEKNYGDIDILVYDKESNKVFSLECKDTNKAKNIHEMKKEMDNYLGRDGGEGMIHKHLKRHEWLEQNKQAVCDFLKIEDEISINSFMITSEVIPTTYLKSGSLPLPILAFPDLKRIGIELMK